MNDKNEELYEISARVDEDSGPAWKTLLQNISSADLENLEVIFKKACGKDGVERGLARSAFQDAICLIIGVNQCSFLVNQLFNEISQNTAQTITWNNFLDFLIANLYPETKHRMHLSACTIQSVAHAKNESVAKVVLIETEQYFCYAIILKHGRVGLYDGNLNFLTSYHAIMTREDLSRPEDERRRRNRWVTDALFCPDTLMFILINTARSIIIYEASGLKHVPYWLILSTPNILECLAYKPCTKQQNNSSSALYSGDSDGNVMSFTFLQPKIELLRRKRNDQITLYYWNDFIKEVDHVVIKNYGKVHKDSVKTIKYFGTAQLLATCSKDPNASVVLKHIENKRQTVHYKMPNGVSCLAFSFLSKILITGSDDGIIKLWNTFISKTIAMFSAYNSPIVDIQVMDGQELFLSCSTDGILKLWCLREYTCLQTIRLKCPCFRVDGKSIEWGINCIYPGPKRKQSNKSHAIESTEDCFGISDVDEMKFRGNDTGTTSPACIWERSSVLITCCNYMATLRANFSNASIEYGFTYPIVPPPPLQNSVLIPANWKLKNQEFTSCERFIKEKSFNMEKQLEELRFILDKNLLDKVGAKSEINYKIAILESKKEKMRSKVALGSPYLALDLHEIPQFNLSPCMSSNNGRKSQKYVEKIQSLLLDAAHKDEIFSSPESSGSLTKSTKSSIVEMPY